MTNIGKSRNGQFLVSGTPLEPGEGFETITGVEAERRFQHMMEEPFKAAAEIGSVDIVVGIPFYNETDTIASVVQTARKGLEEFYPGQQAIIVAVGSPMGDECLKVLNEIPQSDTIRHIAFLLNDERIDGKGWHIRAAMEIGRVVDADLVILEADLKGIERNGEIEGLAPDWIYLLLEPIKRKKMDLVASRFNHHHIESPVSSQLIYPLLSSIYNCPIHDSLGGQWGISHRLLHTYLQEFFPLQAAEIGGYGIDVWLVTRAVTEGASICESYLGTKIPRESGKTELVLHHAVETLFERIIADSEYWKQDAAAADETPLLNRLPVFRSRKAHYPEPFSMNPQQLFADYRRGFDRFRQIYSTLLPDDTYLKLEAIVESSAGEFQIPDDVWATTIYHLLLAFAFDKEFAKGDIISAVIPIFDGRMAGFSLEMQSLSTSLKSLNAGDSMELVSLQAEHRIEAMVDKFIFERQDFVTEWRRNEEVFKSPVPKVTYREFTPGVHLVVPLEVSNPEGVTVSANAVYETVFSRYKGEFETFVYDKLKLPRNSSSTQIITQIHDFMHKVELLLGKALLTGNLSTVKGTLQVVESIFSNFHRENVFALTPEVCYQVLLKNPPNRLLTRLGHGDLPSLLREYEPNEALSLASWSEEPEYEEWILAFLRRTLTPQDFQSTRLQPLVVNHKQLPLLMEMRECGGLCKLSGQVVVSDLRKGIGGKFPRLRYLTSIAKTIIEMERFGRIWQRWSGDRRDGKDKIINSLEGHWGRAPLSAHNIFENGHQRVLVQRMTELSQQLINTAGHDDLIVSLAEDLQKIADSYHLALTLPDGTFIPCSAWSWASYSFKGGIGLPTPLSLHVERDWSSYDFLAEYYKATGGKEEDIDKEIVELMGQGRESEDLAPILLGSTQDADAIVQMEFDSSQQPPAGTLVRYDGNPILKPIKEHSWESRYVLNPGAIRLDGKVFLVYRAFGQDKISRLGLAVSEDGFNFTERLDKPIFEPHNKNEEKGCEDARLTIIGDRIYMLYTAYSNVVAQIGMASIHVNDFINYNWKGWERHGMVFPGFSNKDGVLFPKQFNDKYIMLHRVDPHIWITSSLHMSCPWPRKEHRILAGSTYGMMWDGKKIGGGTQPIETKYGWLLITHGVDYFRFYRLGILLLDLTDPTVIIYRSPNAILEPTEKYEEGEVGSDWVPNVVFTCGAVPRHNGKEVLDADDELLVYYGAADSVIGVATARVGDLIPSEFLDNS
ncbi:glycosidase [Chloroflexota bacterium]